MQRYNKTILSKLLSSLTTPLDFFTPFHLLPSSPFQQRKRFFSVTSKPSSLVSNESENENDTTTPSSNVHEEKKDRLEKRIARAGVASRRASLKLIQEGRVKVNGEVATIEKNAVVSKKDRIEVDGVRVHTERTRLWMHHKKAGVLVANPTNKNNTESSPSNEEKEKPLPSLFPKLNEIMGRSHIIAVGRLDINTEGLLLITNDGNLARYLSLPTNQFERVYRARVHGKFFPDIIQALERGPTIEKIRYAPMKVTVDREINSNCWVTLTLKEGKNREVKKVLNAFNIQVTRLIRTHFGPFTLESTLKPGDTKEIEIPHEIQNCVPIKQKPQRITSRNQKDTINKPNRLKKLKTRTTTKAQERWNRIKALRSDTKSFNNESSENSTPRVKPTKNMKPTRNRLKSV